MLDRKFWLKQGPNTRDRYRDHIFTKAKDVKGNNFKGYTKAYEQKKAGGRSKNKRFTKGAKFTSPVLTGDLERDYTLIEERNGFAIGWVSQGAKIEWLKNNGRVLTTEQQPLPKKVLKNLYDNADRYIKKGMDKIIPNKTTTHNIGK